MRIEVWIKDNDCIGTPQIDADTSSASGQKKNEYIGVLPVEVVHSGLPIGLLRITILQVVERRTEGSLG